jgi:superfamily II helicase
VHPHSLQVAEAAQIAAVVAAAAAAAGSPAGAALVIVERLALGDRASWRSHPRLYSRASLRLHHERVSWQAGSQASCHHHVQV